MTEPLPRIASVTHTGPTVLAVTWDDGVSDCIDLADWIATGGDILASLKDEAAFATVRLGDYGAWVEWGPADGDLAIDAYHLRMIADEQR